MRVSYENYGMRLNSDITQALYFSVFHVNQNIVTRYLLFNDFIIRKGHYIWIKM